MDTTGVGALAFILIFAGMGLIYLGYPLLCILLGVFVASKLRKKCRNHYLTSAVGSGVAIVFIALPFADYPSIQREFLERCEQDGGVTVLRAVKDVDGVHGLINAYKYGYFYGEEFVKDSDQRTVRRHFKPLPSSKANGRTEDGANVSLYGIRWSRLVVDKHTTRYESQTYVLDTGEVLGRYVSYSRFPGQNDPDNLGQRITINSFRRWLRMSCYEDGSVAHGKYLRELLLRTLIPRKESVE